MQNVTILGMVLQDRTTEEALVTANRFLRNSAVDIVVFVDCDALLRAEKEVEIKELLSQAAMVEWTDKKLLEIADIKGYNRAAEVSERRLLKSLLKNIADIGGGVAVAGASTESIDKLREELMQLEPSINLIHDAVLENPGDGIPEEDINGINEHAPALIVSRMDYGVLYKWLRQSKSMINAGIWLVIPEHMSILSNKEKSIFMKVRHSIRCSMLRRRAGR